MAYCLKYSLGKVSYIKKLQLQDALDFYFCTERDGISSNDFNMVLELLSIISMNLFILHAFESVTLPLPSMTAYSAITVSEKLLD